MRQNEVDPSAKILLCKIPFWWASFFKKRKKKEENWENYGHRLKLFKKKYSKILYVFGLRLIKDE